jgi:3-hydroxyisobutyrate dehydrogenase
MKTPQKLGFVGLGKMGYPMARRLAGAGFALTVFDINRGVQERFVAENRAQSAENLSEVARNSDLIITMLPDSKAVRSAVLGADQEDGIAASMAPGSILVDMSSSAPLVTRELGARLTAKGIVMVDAPVSGGVPKAINGTLSIIVGGNEDTLECCRPIFQVMGDRIFFSGPLGSGHAVKALNNMLSATGLIAATEMLLVGRRFGVDPKVMNEILNASTGRNNSTENKIERYILSRSFSSGFSLDLMVKDLNTAMELARELEVPTIFSNCCRELCAAARLSLGKGMDHTDVVRWFEQLAQIRLGE